MPGPLPDAGGGTRVLATVHPSAALRAPDRRETYAGPAADLRTVVDALGAHDARSVEQIG
ncbi:hypothetical protein [Streptomyces litmocidini]|uniref:hypothetical protein n=1 Tax=Streptomyces litmocidini TaxID=67318 RepID=UPI00167DA758|nr:hypothetical protein [Streptomyces litmocidini]